MSNDVSVDPARQTCPSPACTLTDWAAARMVPRERAQKDRNKAMHITLGEVRGRIKPAAVAVLRVLVDGCFPDKIRRAGSNLILRIDYLSVGTIAKRAHWCDIDERDAARLDAEGNLTDEARRSLLAAKRRVDRALAQLQAAGLITRTRRAGGRSITVIELRAPFDAEEPGATPPPGDSTDKPAARNDANVAPGGPARNDGRRHRYDVFVAPSPLSSPAPEVPPNDSLLPPEPTADQRMGIKASLIRLGVESGAAQSVALHPNLTLALVRSTLAAVKADKTVRSQAAVVLTRLRRELEMSEGPTPTIEQEPIEQEPIEQEPDEEPIKQADEERAAIVALLTTNGNANANMAARFIAAGGAESDASGMSERFIDWSLDATRGKGTILDIVEWYRRRMGATR